MILRLEWYKTLLLNLKLINFYRCGSEAIPTCIVDEATQCCEPETLIPLILGVKNLILVGDPNQLPATVMSSVNNRN